MEVIEFESKVLDGKYLLIPDDMLDKIMDYGKVDVILKLGRDAIQNRRDIEESRIQAAFDEYMAKYPEDDVTLDDFQYVGILSEGVKGEYKLRGLEVERVRR